MSAHHGQFAVIAGTNLLRTLPTEILHEIAKSEPMQSYDVAAFALASQEFASIITPLVKPEVLQYSAIKYGDRRQIFRLVQIHGLDNLRSALQLEIDGQYALEHVANTNRFGIFDLISGLVPAGHESLIEALKITLEKRFLAFFYVIRQSLTDDQTRSYFRELYDTGNIKNIDFFTKSLPTHLKHDICTEYLNPAVYTENMDILYLLISHGARVNEVRVLSESNPVPQTLLESLIKGSIKGMRDSRDILGFIKLIISHGGDINARDNLGRTFLHYMSMVGPRNILFKGIFAPSASIDEVLNAHRLVTLFLAKKMSSIDTPDISGRTALHCAVFSNNLLMTELLLRQGSNPALEDCFGHTVDRVRSNDDGANRTLCENIVAAFRVQHGL